MFVGINEAFSYYITFGSETNYDLPCNSPLFSSYGSNASGKLEGIWSLLFFYVPNGFKSYEGFAYSEILDFRTSIKVGETGYNWYSFLAYRTTSYIELCLSY